MVYKLDLTYKEYSDNIVKLKLLAKKYRFTWIEEIEPAAAVYRRLYVITTE